MRSRIGILGCLIALAVPTWAQEPTIRIGHATAKHGAARVPIEVATGGLPIVTLAPLRVRFDPERITFDGCTARHVALWTNEAPSGQLNIVAYTLQPWPRYRIIAQCRFLVDDGTPGLVPLVGYEAGLSTSDTIDVDGTVISGSILIP